MNNCFFLTTHAWHRLGQRCRIKSTLSVLVTLSEIVWQKKYSVLIELERRVSDHPKVMHKPTEIIFVLDSDLSNILTVNPKPTNKFKKKRCQNLF